MVLFGQIVVGPAGCGKTTYCMGMQMFVEAVGRSCKVVNLDFANDSLPYTPAIDVRELVSLEVNIESYQLLHRSLTDREMIAYRCVCYWKKQRTKLSNVYCPLISLSIQQIFVHHIILFRFTVRSKQFK